MKPSTKHDLPDELDRSVAASVAPEDLCRGDFVAVLSEIIEVPSFLWTETLASRQDEMVRLYRLPTGNRAPLKIKAICLPFVFVKSPGSEFQTIDIRLANLVRLDQRYARKVWKSLRSHRPRPSLWS